MKQISSLLAHAHSFRWKEWIHIFFDRDKEHADISPRRDWLFIVAVSVIISGVGVFVGFSLLIAVSDNTDIFFEDGGTSSDNILRQDELEKALELYRKKDAHFNELLVGGPRLADPSL